MRLALLIKDYEYRSALEDFIAESGGDIFLDIIEHGESIEKDTLVLTDAKPADIDNELLDLIKDRIVFLVTDAHTESDSSKLHKLFKYCNVSRLLADISDIYYSWKGLKSHNIPTSRIIACCTDTDAFSQMRCTRLASQIMYRQGGSILILPLGYISEQSVDFGRDINRFARLMFRIRKDRICDPSSISYTDSYGISRLMLPSGRNPISYLDEEDLMKIITAMSSAFETVILDIGSCYRPENLTALRNANSVLCFQSYRNRINFRELIKSEDREKLKIIRISNDTDEEFEVDEYVGDLYGTNNERRYKKG